MHTFYVDNLTQESKEIQLSEEQSKHAIRVMRMTQGQEFMAINGQGMKSKCEILVAHKSNCIARVISTEFQENKGKKVSIAIAPTKNMDRIEWFCEKATEIGIHEIFFFISSNSERKKIRLDRLEKIVISATKQSQRFYKPILHELTPLKEILESTRKQSKFIAHCEDQEKVEFKNEAKEIDECLILIGPEGDFSKEEINLAKENNFQPISLGENRLRTETAGLVALHSALL